MSEADGIKAIDLQALIKGVARLELKLLNAGVDAAQVYFSQAAHLSDLAGVTLKALEQDKASLADATHKLTSQGRRTLQAYADLAQRLGGTYFTEVDHLIGGLVRRTDGATRASTDAKAKSQASSEPRSSTDTPSA
ncbi:MAG: hypothetical protein E6Q67_00360 [Roseateles sp.]|nr:MAG: hypothetical protein E6Q67_00360 [Roseateles sp.]